MASDYWNSKQYKRAALRVFFTIRMCTHRSKIYPKLINQSINQSINGTQIGLVTLITMKKALRETQTLRAAYAGGVRPPSLYRI